MDGQTPEELLEQRTQFFLNELAAVDDASKRRYAQLAERVRELESKRTRSDEELLSSSMMYFMLAITFAPLIFELVSKVAEKWRSPNSQELSS